MRHVRTRNSTASRAPFFFFFILVTLGKKKRKRKKNQQQQHKQHFHTLMCNSPRTPPLARVRKTGWIVRGDGLRLHESGEWLRRRVGLWGEKNRESLSNYKMTGSFPAKLQKSQQRFCVMYICRLSLHTALWHHFEWEMQNKQNQTKLHVMKVVWGRGRNSLRYKK